MNHSTNDELLLLAFGELPEPAAGQIEAHVATCLACQTQLARFERGRLALDVALPARRRSARIWIALAAAAAVAGVVMSRPTPTRDPAQHWTSTTMWSATAGYVTDRAMVDIDAQLTRLEQERSHG